MIQIRYGCVIFLVAVFVVTLESRMLELIQTLIHLSKFCCACARPNRTVPVFR